MNEESTFTFTLLQLLLFLVDDVHNYAIYDANISPELACFAERQPHAERQQCPPATSHLLQPDLLQPRRYSHSKILASLTLTTMDMLILLFRCSGYNMGSKHANPGLWLPSQSHSIAGLWSAPHYLAWVYRSDTRPTVPKRL